MTDPMATLHDFTVTTIEGESRKLSSYAGKVALVVNVASQCGLTPQYAGLEELYRTYRDRGLVVLGFPCNQFGGQEPGTEAAIKTFCETRFGVTFPMFAKLEVNGPGRHPLYTYLTAEPTKPDGPGDIAWNFAKFLVDGKGKVVARFAPSTAPVSEEVLGVLEPLLA